MNPATLALVLQAIQAAFALYPQVLADIAAMKGASGTDPATLAALEAQIEALDAQRLATWAQADAVLEAAAAT